MAHKYTVSNFATSCVFKVGIYCGPLTYIYKSLTENIPFMSATWASMDIRSVQGRACYTDLKWRPEKASL